MTCRRLDENRDPMSDARNVRSVDYRRREDAIRLFGGEPWTTLCKTRGGLCKTRAGVRLGGFFELSTHKDSLSYRVSGVLMNKRRVCMAVRFIKASEIAARFR